MPEDRSDDSSEMVGEIFGVLSRPERRCLLYYLRDHRTATRDELATVLSGWLQAREERSEVVTPDERERLRASLHHVDLPKLADLGVVRYDYESGEVELDEVTDLLDIVLDTALAQERQTRSARADEEYDQRDREER